MLLFHYHSQFKACFCSQNWRNSSIKIYFYLYLEKCLCKRCYLCVLAWGVICYPMVTKKIPRDCTKSTEAEKASRMTNPRSGSRDTSDTILGRATGKYLLFLFWYIVALWLCDFALCQFVFLRGLAEVFDWPWGTFRDEEA